MSSFEPFAIYWRLYGGIHALVRSIYLWMAVAVTLMCSPYWLAYKVAEQRDATGTALSVAPSLMAFTLSGMALVLALSGGRFIDVVRQSGKPDSLLMKLAALFFHFILVETIALLLAFVSKAYPSSSMVAAFMFFFMSYGITSAVAIAAMLINVARIYNVTGSGESNNHGESRE